MRQDQVVGKLGASVGWMLSADRRKKSFGLRSVERRDEQLRQPKPTVHEPTKSGRSTEQERRNSTF